jgi:hypothetical protein
MRAKWLYVRNISYPPLILNSSDDLIRKLARNLGCIHAPHIAIQPLPLRNPGFRGVGQRNKALEDLRCAVDDGVHRAPEMEELFAVRAPFLEESLQVAS